MAISPSACWLRWKLRESPDVKAAVAERYNRTLKSRLWKHFTKTKDYPVGVYILPKALDEKVARLHGVGSLLRTRFKPQTEPQTEYAIATG